MIQSTYLSTYCTYLSVVPTPYTFRVESVDGSLHANAPSPIWTVEPVSDRSKSLPLTKKPSPCAKGGAPLTWVLGCAANRVKVHTKQLGLWAVGDGSSPVGTYPRFESILRRVVDKQRHRHRARNPSRPRLHKLGLAARLFSFRAANRASFLPILLPMET